MKLTTDQIKAANGSLAFAYANRVVSQKLTGSSSKTLRFSVGHRRPTGISQVNQKRNGHVRGQPVNARLVDEFAIDVIETTMADYPTAPYRFNRTARKGVFRQNGASTPGWGNYVVPGTSKFPFGQMKIGNSFFVKLYEPTKAEANRIRTAVRGSLAGHIRRGHLPTLFSLSSIIAQRNGELGVAFFRIN